MRITITPPATSAGPGTPFVLGDDTIASMAGPTLNFLNGAPGLMKEGLATELHVATERDELVDAPYAFETTRLNRQLTYSFTTSRSFDTQDNSLMFVADHPTLVPVFGVLQITIGSTSRFLYNAVLKSVRVVEHSNLSNVMQYSISGSYVPPISGGANATGTGGPFTTQ